MNFATVPQSYPAHLRQIMPTNLPARKPLDCDDTGAQTAQQARPLQLAVVVMMLAALLISIEIGARPTEFPELLIGP
jgi:hypothetical protein